MDKGFDVSTKGPTKLHSSINTALEKRIKKEDLNYTLV